MTSTHTAQFMAIARIAQHSPARHPERPSLDRVVLRPPQGEHPYLDTITDPAVMTRELALRREHYNTVRLHEGIGYHPDDEHHGRAPRHPQSTRNTDSNEPAQTGLPPTGNYDTLPTQKHQPMWSIEIPDWLVISEAPRLLLIDRSVR